MRLRKLFIRNFKNLQDFSVSFGESDTTVLVGRNGTGKSNLLEALTIIFRDLDLGSGPAFKFKLEYECNRQIIRVEADPDRKSGRYLVYVGRSRIPYSKFIEAEGRPYLPRFVFGYYSGPSSRLEEHFTPHQERFYRELIKDRPELDDYELPLRPLFYARLVHSHFVLLSFFVREEPSILTFLKENLRIEGLDSVLFVIKQPLPWGRGKDPHDFWGARGAVRQFLERLRSLSLKPTLSNFPVSLGFRKTTRLDHWYFYLKDLQDLRKLAQEYTTEQDFFKALESTYISELLGEVRIKVKVRNIEGGLTFRELSEGEQQLLTVLGLLKFTNQDESLFLLDEPDTHLNPAWSLDYLSLLKKYSGGMKNSQIVMATHDPLVITNLERQQVRLLYFDDNKEIHSMPPEEDLRGMGVNALLESELFGLRSTLGANTLDKIEARNRLFAKDNRTKEEEYKLTKLSTELADIGIHTSYRDPTLNAFAKAYARRQKKFKKVFTKEELEHQEEIADEILDEIYEEDD